MKVLVTQEKLSKALVHVSKISSNKNSLPILSNVLLKTTNNRLELISTNLEQAITERLVGKIEKEGQITVPARLLSEFINSLPSGQTIEIEKEENKINISSERFKATINGTPSEEFPSIPEVKGEKTLRISSQVLKNSLQQVVFAASRDETRQILNGVLFTFDGKDVYIAATDSYRLAEKKISNIEIDTQVVLPASSLSELMRIIEDGEEEVEVKIDNNQAQFTYRETELITKIIEGEYPKYKQLIPKTSEINVIVEKRELLEITKVASLFAEENAGGVKIEVSEEEQEIKINSIASQVGENTSTTKAVISGSGEVTLNSRYIIDALNSFEGKKIQFRFSGKLSPFVIEQEEQEEHIHIIMPLKS